MRDIYQVVAGNVKAHNNYFLQKSDDNINLVILVTYKA